MVCDCIPITSTTLNDIYLDANNAYIAVQQVLRDMEEVKCMLFPSRIASVVETEYSTQGHR